MREITDRAGTRWQAMHVATHGAHRKLGATLAFRRVDQPDAEPLFTPITFNSDEAAELAIRTMSDAELRRRLTMAGAVAGR
jgi:hypothetical protein